MLWRLLTWPWLALWDRLWKVLIGPTVVWETEWEGWDDSSPVRSQHLA